MPVRFMEFRRKKSRYTPVHPRCIFAATSRISFFCVCDCEFLYYSLSLSGIKLIIICGFPVYVSIDMFLCRISWQWAWKGDNVFKQITFAFVMGIRKKSVTFPATAASEQNEAAEWIVFKLPQSLGVKIGKLQCRWFDKGGSKQRRVFSRLWFSCVRVYWHVFEPH